MFGQEGRRLRLEFAVRGGLAKFIPQSDVIWRIEFQVEYISCHKTSY
jgi:hypothetical protein